MFGRWIKFIECELVGSQRLFIESLKRSLKAVRAASQWQQVFQFVHGLPCHLKDTYGTMSRVLEMIIYNVYCIQRVQVICSDLKVVAMLCGMQINYTKYMCSLCL